MQLKKFKTKEQAEEFARNHIIPEQMNIGIDFDLFGNPIVETHKTNSPYIRFKKRNNYRLAENKNQSCKTCKFHECHSYHDKYYHKCKLIGISSSEATDIRLKNVCNQWKIEK